jgi:hypothetical protein
MSADLLVMNAKDRAPIVAEFKRGGDRDADYALVQALAAAAQLTPKSQRERLRTEYSEFFGTKVPELLDVYVIPADPPPRAFVQSSWSARYRTPRTSRSTRGWTSGFAGSSSWRRGLLKESSPSTWARPSSHKRLQAECAASAGPCPSELSPICRTD